MADLSGLFDALGAAGSKIIDAKTQTEIAKINAQALRPPAPYPAPMPVAANLTTAQKVAELARSPLLWVSVAVLIVGAVLVLRR